MKTTEHGYFDNGLPFNRFGRGPATLVVFQGVQFENRPQSGPAARYSRGLYKPLEAEYTVYVVTRRPGLPQGYSLREMAADYASAIREAFRGPVDVVGLSTGGLIAQHFAAEHRALVRRLAIHSSAYRLGDEAKALQARVARLARESRWLAAYAAIFEFMSPWRQSMPRIARLAAWLAAPLGGSLLGRPASASDLLVTYAASNDHDFRSRLAEIEAPTLIVAGDRDPFYPPALVRETAAGIRGSRLILYEGVGHPASGRRFVRDLASFLSGGGPSAATRSSVGG